MGRYWSLSSRRWTALISQMRSTSDVYVCHSKFESKKTIHRKLVDKCAGRIMMVLWFSVLRRLFLPRMFVCLSVWAAEDGSYQMLWYFQRGQAHWSGWALGGLSTGRVLYAGYQNVHSLLSVIFSLDLNFHDDNLLAVRTTHGPEWQGEVRRAPRCSLYGSGQGDQADGTDRLHKICPHPHVRDGHEGQCGIIPATFNQNRQWCKE